MTRVYIIPVLALSLLSRFSSASISWSLYTKPAVFGDDVELHCELSNHTFLNASRIWENGINRNAIVMNGVSVNKSKYSEKFKKSERESILTIMSLDEKDVNIPYTCRDGFETYQDYLKMTVENFEYHPKEKEIDTYFRHDDEGILFSVKFDKVYPVPKCSAIYGNLNISDKLNITVRPNNAFFMVQIYLQCQHVSKDCIHLSFDLVCYIGKKIIVERSEPKKNVCSQPTQRGDSAARTGKDQTLGILGHIVFTCVVVFYLVIFILPFLIRLSKNVYQYISRIR